MWTQFNPHNDCGLSSVSPILQKDQVGLRSHTPRRGAERGEGLGPVEFRSHAQNLDAKLLMM